MSEKAISLSLVHKLFPLRFTPIHRGTETSDLLVFHPSFSHHYVEYLCYLIRDHELETIDILTTDDLEIVVRRQSIRMPPRPFGIIDGIYRQELAKVRGRAGLLYHNGDLVSTTVASNAKLPLLLVP